MKPIKPRKLSKKLESRLKTIACDTPPHLAFDLKAPTARAILAALEYERQRADDAEKDSATETGAKLKAWKEVADLKAEIERIRPHHWHD